MCFFSTACQAVCKIEEWLSDWIREGDGSIIHKGDFCDAPTLYPRLANVSAIYMHSFFR